MSQSEFSSFVTAHGGTETEAANDFAALDTSNSGSITSSNITDAINNLQNSYQNDPYAAIVSMFNMFASNTTTGSSVSVSA